jgi:hypothetical protein
VRIYIRKNVQMTILQELRLALVLALIHIGLYNTFIMLVVSLKNTITKREML